MSDIYYPSSVDYKFIRDLTNILDIQYEKYKSEIVKIILLEIEDEFKNKLLKNKELIIDKNGESSNRN